MNDKIKKTIQQTKDDKCVQCGSFITGDVYQNENEEIICEDCLINNMAKRKGLINE